MEFQILTGIEYIPNPPPGPRLPTFVQTMLWGLQPIRYGEWCRRRYGGTFSSRAFDGSRVVVITDPASIKQLFVLTHDEFRSGELPAPLLEPFLGRRSVLLLDGEVHRKERRMMQHAFHGEHFETYRQIVADATSTEVASWPVGETFALRPHMQTITFEVILRAVFGVDEAEALGPLRTAMDFLLDPAGSVTILVPMFRRDFGRHSPWGKFVRRRAVVHREVLALIRARRDDPQLAGRRDVLSLLLQARDEAGGAMSDEQLLDELMTMLLAGHDTTSTALAWAFDLLLHHPAARARLVEDLEAGGEAYLDAVIQEALRIRVVVPDVGRRLQHDRTFDGHVVPAGTIVSPNIHLTHRRADVYDAPDEFRPERFLGQAPDTFAWIPFGGGIRRCLGAGFAMIELREVLRTVLTTVQLRAASPSLERPKRRAVTLMPARGTRVVVESINPTESALRPDSARRADGAGSPPRTARQPTTSR